MNCQADPEVPCRPWAVQERNVTRVNMTSCSSPTASGVWGSTTGTGRTTGDIGGGPRNESDTSIPWMDPVERSKSKHQAEMAATRPAVRSRSSNGAMRRMRMTMGNRACSWSNSETRSSPSTSLPSLLRKSVQ
jgi:hypothetical protein